MAPLPAWPAFIMCCRLISGLIPKACIYISIFIIYLSYIFSANIGMHSIHFLIFQNCRSFTVLSICLQFLSPSTSQDLQGQTLVTQQPVVYVHNFHLPQPCEMVAMNLHCIWWSGKQPSSKWLLMMMPHCKECEHSMEMVQQAGWTRGRRCGIGWSTLKWYG